MVAALVFARPLQSHGRRQRLATIAVLNERVDEARPAGRGKKRAQFFVCCAHGDARSSGVSGTGASTVLLPFHTHRVAATASASATS